jgi:hypothetical protein
MTAQKTTQKTTEIAEAATLGEELSGSRYKVRLIEGNRLGSSGYYPAEMLLRDGPQIFKAGTPMFFNHQSVEEKAAFPHGRLEAFAGELVTDAYYDNDGLYADIEVFEHQRPIIKSLKDKIGISIRAKAVTVPQNINGKMIPVVQELVEARSADFVMRAGAGGKIVSILESALEEDIEEGKDSMDEVLEAIKSLRGDLETRLTVLEEAAKPAETVIKKEVDYDQVLEIAEALSKSTLDDDGKARVLDLHRANSKPLAELIEAEEAYVKRTASASTTVVEGNVEDVEESAKPNEIKIPSAWKRNK